MSRKKAFWLSFFITLAVLLPIYAAVILYGTVRGAKPADTAQSGVWVAQAKRSDAQTVLVMTGAGTAQTADTFALVRFDAYNERLCVATLPPETIVLIGGAPYTLTECVQSAGPSQAIAALRETLGIEVNHYLFAAPRTLWSIAEQYGTVRLPLSSYLSDEALTALHMTADDGAQTQTLTPRMLAEALQSGYAAGDTLCTLRAKGYAAFLAAGAGRLADTLPQSVRTNSSRLATNISATELYDYERTLQFLDKRQPDIISQALPGTWAGERYELNDESVAFAVRYLAAVSTSPAA